MALGIGAGDEVITTPFTFFATAGSIWRVGAKPVFVDIDPRTFNIDSHRVEGAVSAKTKAIMPVHLFGQAADMDPILDLSSRRGLHVIEDAAQAIGAEYKDRRVGSFGTAGCFSFFPSKNLGGAGDGGMIVTRDAAFAEKLLFFRNHGSEIKYYHKWVGGNFRLDTIQAAYLLIKLEHLDEWSEGRRRNAALYAALLSDVPELVLPWVSPDCRSIYNQYVIRTPRRDALRKHLSERGIGTEVYYPLNLHEQECFRDLGYAKGDFPEAEKAALEVLALPIYPELREEQIRHVAASIREFHGR
jgi:dTDP-4-amino-4,6-dideoxygalactose transaminase